MHRKKWNKPRPLYASPVSKEVRQPKVKWRLFPILWTSLKRGATVLGFLMIFSSLVSVTLSVVFLTQGAQSVPDNAVLYIDLEGGLNERRSNAGLAAALGGAKPSVHEIVQAIDKAALDDRVHGLITRLRDGSFSFAHIQEIRSALRRFQKSGKFTKIYSSSYGGAGNDMGRYYLAAAHDEIWMQPMGVVMIPGYGMELPYFRGSLNKLGIQPQFFQRKEYKTAYESVERPSMSTANREMLGAVVADIKGTLVHDISEDRLLEPAVFEALVDRGMFTSLDALQAGLIDRSDYADVLVEEVSEVVTGDPKADLDYLVGAAGYLAAVTGEEASEAPMFTSDAGGTVAIIFAQGVIMQQDGGSGPGGQQMQVAAADTIAPAILDAAEDEKVQAIVLRIDSPGGSPVASESILRALLRAKEQDKKIVVSMGETAASGGYWIASYADYIFVQPTTLTGSIGVLGGKLSMDGLWQKIGVNWDSVSWGRNRGLMSFNAPFSQSESKAFNAMLDFIYDSFIARVSEGRGMPVAEVEKIAKGRVWTGKSAVENGLADALGGLTDALEYTADLIGEGRAADLTLVYLPRPKSFAEQLAEILDGQGGFGILGGKSGASLGGLEAVAGRLLKSVSMASRPEDYILYDPVLGYQ